MRSRHKEYAYDEPGSQIRVRTYNFPGDEALSANFSIDGGTALTRTDTPNSSGSETIELFYESDMLPLQTHSLYFNITEVSTTRNFTMISILVNQDDQGVGLSTSSASSSASATSATASSSSATASSTGGISDGAVAGIVVAALFVFLSALVALFFWLKRRRDGKEDTRSGRRSSVPTSQANRTTICEKPSTSHVLL